MSFSSFTLGEGVCSSSTQGVLLPTCPLLTFDLALLHLLSTATLALLLVILSNTLSPGYYTSISNLELDSDAEGRGVGTTTDGQGKGMGSMFVMWELAISSPPPSPRLAPATAHSSTTGPSGYGSTETRHIHNDTPPATDGAGAFTSSASTGGSGRKDRFAEGRVVCYSLLLLVSLGVVVGAGLLMGMGEFGMFTPLFLSPLLLPSILYRGCPWLCRGSGSGHVKLQIMHWEVADQTVASSIFMSIVAICSSGFAITL